MIRDFVGDWRWLAVRGAIAVTFGLITLFWPAVTLWALAILWGAFALLEGAFALGALTFRRTEKSRAWLVFRGIAGIGVGIVTFLWPSITITALVIVIAIWAFVTGWIQVAIAFLLRRFIRHEWLLGSLGLVSVILGIVLIANPDAGAVVIAWIVGWYALVFGAMMFALAWEVRHEETLSETFRR